MPQPERIRVAIVGAGIVGLSLAVAINAFDEDHRISIDLYEATPELSEIGAGINVWPKTWKILKHIGLEESLIPALDHFPDNKRRTVFEIRKADQRNGFTVTDIKNDGGVFRIHRADFQRSLIQHLPLPGSSAKINTPCKLHLSHRLINYAYTSTLSSPPASPSGPITLFFSDKPPASCDILVGADGIKSTLRKLFLTRLPNPERFRRFIEPVFSGTTVYRGLVSKEELRKVFPGHRVLDQHPGVMYIGKQKHVVVYPVSGGRLINVVAGIHDKSKEGTIVEGPWNTETTQREFFDSFDGWEDEFRALVHCIKKPTKWLLHKLDHLDIFAKERVFLLGDSAHAMVPHQGAGAGVGIEDAYILASLLTNTSTTPRVPSVQDIKRLANIYNMVRVPRAITMAKASVTQGDIFVLEVPGYERYKEGDNIPKELLVELFRRAERNWLWTTADPEEDRRSALSLGEHSRAMLFRLARIINCQIAFERQNKQNIPKTFQAHDFPAFGGSRFRYPC